MKRSLLALTTALTLSLPAAAFAETDARQTVETLLQTYGYDAAQIETLSTSQVAEIYLASTSEDASDVRQLLSGMNLQHGSVSEPVDFVRTDVEIEVRQVLEDEGYNPDVISMMSDPEVAQIYLASTSGDNSQEALIGQQLATMNLPGDDDMSGSLGTTHDYGSNIMRVVQTRLSTMGYSDAQIAELTEEEMAEVYLAMTSDDATAIQDAIESAFAS